MRFLFLLFILLPILEIMVFIKVGGVIGALNTVILVVLGSMLGMVFIRRRGFLTMRNARMQMALGQLPAQEMLEGFLSALGGLLLILPGFITDTAGLFLQISFIRRLIIRKLRGISCWEVRETHIYEGEYRRESTPDTSRCTIEGEVIDNASSADKRKNKKN